MGHPNVRTETKPLAYVDRSGTITAGGTSQALAAANEHRAYLLVQNTSSETLGIGIGVAATTASPSILLGAGQAWEPLVPPTQALTIIGATTSSAYTAYEA
jgi:hypothetical protein